MYEQVLEQSSCNFKLNHYGLMNSTINGENYISEIDTLSPRYKPLLREQELKLDEKIRCQLL